MTTATAVECLPISGADAAEAIDRCHAILRRAAEGAWRGGHAVVYAMAELRAHLNAYRSLPPGEDKTVPVLAAEAITERLVTVIALWSRATAEYVQEGDEL